MAKEKQDLGRTDVGKRPEPVKPGEVGKQGGDIGKQGGDLGKPGGMPEKKEWEKKEEKPAD